MLFRSGTLDPRPSTLDLQPATNWLSVSLDLTALNRAFGLGWALPANCPRIELHTTGDGQSVSTRGGLELTIPPAIQLQPWNIPTNLIHDPITSFAACRVGSPLLESLPMWARLALGRAPSQFYIWSQVGLPFQTYIAAPVPGATERLAELGARLTAQNAWLATNGLGRFTNATDGKIDWADMMIMEPWIEARPQPAGEWIAAGCFTITRTNRPPPSDLLTQFQNSADIVYYDWEITEDRIQDWLYIGQLLRIALNQAQVPPQSVGIKWLTALGSHLGNCGTSIQLRGPGRFVINRRSSCGFSAAELHLIADWVESPRFPTGLYSRLAPPDVFTRKNMQKMARHIPNSATNSPGTNAAPNMR